METINYKSTEVTGEAWQRVCRVQIDNPHNAIPSLLMVEEEVSPKSGGRFSYETVANLSCQFDPSDPDDVALYDLLNKKYVKLREARDAAALAAITVPEG